MRSTSLPLNLEANREGNGNRRSGRRSSTCSMRRPMRWFSRPPLTVSTSGSSGMTRWVRSTPWYWLPD